jgi:DNA modification methylase
MINWKHANVKIAELKEYEHNPRKIGNKELEKLTSHIKEDGYHQRIIVNNDYTIIGGHQRKKALLASGYTEDSMIDVLIADRLLSEKELDRINVRDNLPFGEYDFDILSSRFDLETLVDFGMPGDMLIGFGEENILNNDEFDTSDLPTEPKSKLGDLYMLGNHRLLCGDSTNAQHVSRLLDGANPILMVTDPPYGVSYQPEWRNNIGDAHGVARNTGKVLNDDRYDWSEAYSLFAGDVAYVWHSSRYTHKFAENIESCGFELINLIIWSKQHFALSRGDYHHQHEPLWYAVKKGKQHNWQGKRDQATIWEIDNNNYGASTKEEQTGHGTQKPLECMLRPILNNSEVGQGVYDPFGGSGTTLIACEKSKRSCYMMELSPAYVDLIVNRWEKETGEKAVLMNE